MTTDIDLTGDHRAVLTTLEFDTTKAGDLQAVMGFRLLDQRGVYLTYYGGFGDRSIKYTTSALRNCGFVGNDIDQAPVQFAAGKLSTEVRLAVEREEWNGKFSNKVKWVNRLSGGRGNTVAPSALSDLSRNLKAKIAEADAENARKFGGEPVDVPPSSFGAGDDIPF